MKNKAVIESCVYCSSFTPTIHKENIDMCCFGGTKIMGAITDRFNIPDWCPLISKEEDSKNSSLSPNNTESVTCKKHKPVNEISCGKDIVVCSKCGDVL